MNAATDPNSLSEKLDVRLIAFDFDGVLTDNRVLVFENGQEAVFCNRSDGLAFEMLRHAGIPVLILSTETNQVVSARGAKLRVPVLQRVQNKAQALIQYCEEHRVCLERVMFVGNDLNDLSALSIVGLPVCPADACKQVVGRCKVVLKTKGGAGVVREVAEELLGLLYCAPKGP